MEYSVTLSQVGQQGAKGDTGALETDTVAGDLYVTGDIGIGTSSPSSALDVIGDIEVSGTVDGRDVAVDGSKLDGIEALADVTDSTNVTAAGALMDSEVTSLSGVKTLTVPDSTTISTFGASLVDDVTAAAALTTLGLTATAAELNLLDGATVTTAELNLLDGATSLGISTPATTTDGGVALFDGTDGSALKDGGVQDAVINGVTVGQSGTKTGRNVALGFNVLPDYNGSSSSGYNVAVGYNAGLSVTSGEENVLIGKDAGRSITTGSDNIIIGESGESITTGSQNVVIGGRLTANSFNGSGVVAIGDFALWSCTGSASATTAVGKSSLSSVTTGSFNTAFGSSSGGSVTTGSDNVLIGQGAGGASSPLQVTTQSTRLVMGNNSITNAYISVSWSVTSDERDKTDFADLSHGLDVVDDIETHTFKFDRRSAYFVTDEDGNIIDKPTPDGTHKGERTFVGFKAQQVQSVLDAAGFPSDVVVDTEDPENLKMKETALIPLLVNAIKELKARVEALENSV